LCETFAGTGNYRVLLLDRNLDEILESQARMIARRGEAIEDTPERRVRLRQEYARIVEQTVRALAARPNVRLLVLRHDEIMRDAAGAAGRIALFTGLALDEANMAAAVDPRLHRNRADRR